MAAMVAGQELSVAISGLNMFLTIQSAKPPLHHLMRLAATDTLRSISNMVIRRATRPTQPFVGKIDLPSGSSTVLLLLVGGNGSICSKFLFQLR
jgi:hypothetical protein